MKLLRVHIISAPTCGGLLDGVMVNLRTAQDDSRVFDPICFVGPNGSGKSQFLQAVAEILHLISNRCAPDDEKYGASDIEFEIEYLIVDGEEKPPAHVLVTRKREGRKTEFLIRRMGGDGWEEVGEGTREARDVLPAKVVAYTSGQNETLSLPFHLSRTGYAEKVADVARNASIEGKLNDPRLMWIDYTTHLELLVSNLLLGSREIRDALLSDTQVADLKSFRCVIQLAHTEAPKTSAAHRRNNRKGVQLTDEHEENLRKLQQIASDVKYDPRKEIYVLEFQVTDAMRTAAAGLWSSAQELYGAFHKFAMLNDLTLKKQVRDRFKRDAISRRFASRLPEPQEEAKVFRFERVCFTAREGGHEIDYVSLSDGEHQLSQLMATFAMVDYRNAIFLLDEPESHFNPMWRIEFVSRLRAMPTLHGHRGATRAPSAAQECIISTHAPFLLSDLSRDRVFLFKKEDGKVKIDRPQIETYGTTFDTLLEECFDLRPPISALSRAEIDDLMKTRDVEKLKTGMARLGPSVERIFLADRLRELTSR